MDSGQLKCKEELEKCKIIPRKYYGQVFTTDEKVIDQLIQTIKSIYRPGTKIVEIGAGLGYISDRLIEEFDEVDCVEFDDELFDVLSKKIVHNKKLNLNNFCILCSKKACKCEKIQKENKFFIQNSKSETKNSESSKKSSNTKNNNTSKIRLIHTDILEYKPPNQDYLLVGNIPFHLSGKLYRKFMSDEDHKPYGMVFITDKQYAKTLAGQPPRCYRVSLQAQAYGDIEIVADVPPSSVYPEPKVMSCIMKITHNPTPLPQNFWKVVNYHFENFPTKEVESPKTMGLQKWLDLCNKNK